MGSDAGTMSVMAVAVDGIGGDGVVLGLDAGTTSAKAVAVDGEGRVRAEAGSDPLSTRTTPDGGSEQDPEEIWRAVTAVGRRVVEGLGSSVRVAALALAAQSGSVVPVSVGGRAEQAITWMDTRSRPLVEGWPPKVAARIRALSGWTATTGVGLSTIAWLQDQRRSVDPTRSQGAEPGRGAGPGRGQRPVEPVDSVARWASADDYMVFRLTGQWAANPSNAAGMQLMDVSTRAWSDELCRLDGVDRSMLSPMVESGAVAGGLTADASDTLGLPTGTPVVVGGHDQACAALALGVVAPGDLFLSVGTAWVLTIVTDQPHVAALPPALNLSSHVVPGLWTASTNLGGLGALIAEGPPDRILAAFETCAVKVRQALDAAGDAAAGRTELMMVGGGTQSDELIEMIADAINRPVNARPDASWPAMGAASLAAAAVGGTPPAKAT